MCYDCKGEEHEHISSFYACQPFYLILTDSSVLNSQCVSDRRKFTDFLSQITQHYRDGRPLHSTQYGQTIQDNPSVPAVQSVKARSIFHVVDKANFQAMTSSEIQINLRTHVLVLPDMEVPHYHFSGIGLRQLNSLNTDVMIEGSV